MPKLITFGQSPFGVGWFALRLQEKMTVRQRGTQLLNLGDIGFQRCGYNGG
jgi:hypothetical protein